MKFIKLNSLFLIVSFFFSVNAFCQNDTLVNKAYNPDVAVIWDAIHNLNSIYIGGGINKFKENPEARDFTNADFGVNLGFFKPLLKRDKFSLGLLASGAYSFVNNDYGAIENPISYRGATAVSTSSQGKQSLLRLGIGPQLNFLVGQRILISPMVQGGYLVFTQDALTITQEINTSREVFNKEVFKQNAINESNFFIKPALKISYAITKTLSVWAEGSYLFANTTTTQNALTPNGSSKDGVYFWDQIMSANSFMESNKEISLNSVGTNFGLAFRFGRGQNYSGTGHVDVFRGRNPQMGGRRNSSNMKKETSENLSPSDEFSGVRNGSGILIDFEDDAIKDPNPTDTLQVKANHNTTRSNQSSGIKDIDSNNPKPVDSLQVKANHNAGSQTNPYFVSNELEGEMLELANNSTSGSNSSVDASKIKEVKKESDLRGREVVLYQNGKRYYYDASKKKVRAILKSFENDNVEKGIGNCPPPGMDNCTYKGGFCWCYLKADRKVDW